MVNNYYRYLIVDDDDDELLMMSFYFNDGMRNNIKFFNNAKACMSYLKSLDEGELPVLILTDLQMPKVSGFGLIEQIKADAGLQAITVYAYSTCKTDFYVQRCRQLGAADFFPKPDSPADYELFVKRLFQPDVMAYTYK